MLTPIMQFLQDEGFSPCQLGGGNTAPGLDCGNGKLIIVSDDMGMHAPGMACDGWLIRVMDKHATDYDAGLLESTDSDSFIHGGPGVAIAKTIGRHLGNVWHNTLAAKIAREARGKAVDTHWKDLAPRSSADFAAHGAYYLAEIDGPLLTICRASDGRALLFGGHLPAQFRKGVASHGVERAIQTFLRLAPHCALHGGEWQDSPYKPGIVPEILKHARQVERALT